MPDLRPELPARPFCWPFVLFPPDMTFHPRSLHAYHRKELFQTGRLPFRKNVESSDTKLYDEIDRRNLMNNNNNNDNVKKRPKSIARIPSILSKVI